MRRPHANSVEAIGSDSFLDVVTNIVGILIILVMVAGMQAGKAVVSKEPPPPTEAELATLSATGTALISNIKEIDVQRQYVERATQARNVERQQLATVINIAEQELEQRKNRLDGSQRELLDLERALAEGRTELARRDAERAQLAAAEAPPILLDNYPTPIAKTVVGKQMHCRLSRGRIAILPLDELVDVAMQSMRRRQWKPEDIRGYVDEVGPVGGFRLRFAIGVESERGTDQIRAGIRQWQAVPESWQMGETLTDALAPRSEFRAALAALDPKDCTITAWIYPDSFAEFQQLKTALYQRGFSVAARPLPDNVLIAGSTRGTRSAAQ